MLTQRAQHASSLISLSGGRVPLLSAAARRPSTKLRGTKTTQARAQQTSGNPWVARRLEEVASLSNQVSKQVKAISRDPTVEFASELLQIVGMVLGTVLLFFWCREQIASGL